MAVKSLTITEDAYATLKRLKHGDESFSKVILRVGRERGGDIEKYFGILKMSEDETEKMIRKMKERRAEFSKEMENRQKHFKKLREDHGGA